MYAALLICKQIDEGNLSFDDTLEMFEATKGVKYGNIITVKMLLCKELVLRGCRCCLCIWILVI